MTPLLLLITSLGLLWGAEGAGFKYRADPRTGAKRLAISLPNGGAPIILTDFDEKPYSGPKNLVDVNRPSDRRKFSNYEDASPNQNLIRPSNFGGYPSDEVNEIPQRPQRPTQQNQQRPRPSQQRPEEDGYFYPKPKKPFNLPSGATTRRPQVGYPDVPLEENFGFGQNSEENKDLLAGERRPDLRPPPTRPQQPTRRPTLPPSFIDDSFQPSRRPGTPGRRPFQEQQPSRRPGSTGRPSFTDNREQTTSRRPGGNEGSFGQPPRNPYSGGQGGSSGAGAAGGGGAFRPRPPPTPPADRTPFNGVRETVFAGANRGTAFAGASRDTNFQNNNRQGSSSASAFAGASGSNNRSPQRPPPSPPQAPRRPPPPQGGFVMQTNRRTSQSSSSNSSFSEEESSFSSSGNPSTGQRGQQGFPSGQRGQEGFQSGQGQQGSSFSSGQRGPGTGQRDQQSNNSFQGSSGQRGQQGFQSGQGQQRFPSSGQQGSSFSSGQRGQGTGQRDQQSNNSFQGSSGQRGQSSGGSYGGSDDSDSFLPNIPPQNPNIVAPNFGPVGNDKDISECGQDGQNEVFSHRLGRCVPRNSPRRPSY